MTARQELAAKITLMGFVLFFVIFFSRPQGKFRAVGLGEVVPNFTLPKDTDRATNAIPTAVRDQLGKDSQTVSITDFRGKIVVLNLWASWCVPCVDEIPSLKQFAARYQDKGVVVIGVSRDEDPVAYKEFLAKYQVNFLTLRNASNSVGELYGTYQIPETYIISRDGHLLNKIIGAADWNGQQMLSYMDSLLSSS
jgi:cytochrome c biogenesis protein CcmG, thiol:disulfide interchange protein DsbE